MYAASAGVNWRPGTKDGRLLAVPATPKSFPVLLPPGEEPLVDAVLGVLGALALSLPINARADGI